MSDNDRPKSGHEIATGFGSLLATVRGGEPQKDTTAPARAREAPPEDVEEQDEGQEVQDIEAKEDQQELAEDDQELTEGDEDESAATEVEEFALDLKVNGENYRITDRAEATKLAQLGKHFTQKNEELISRQQAFEQERQGVTEIRQRYLEALPQIEAYLKSPLGEAPKETDYKDRASYLEAKDAYNETLVRVGEVQAEMQRERQEQAEEQMRKLGTWAESQEQETLAAVPEWTDPQVREAEVREMTEYALGLGMPQQALQTPQLTHAKWFRLMLRDAAAYRKAAERGTTEVKRVSTKDAAPGSGSEMRTQNKGKKLREHKQRVRKSGGRVEEAAPLMSALLDRQRTLTKR